MVKHTRKAHSWTNVLKKKYKNVSRRVRRMLGMKGGGSCPKGGDHSWALTGAKMSDVKYRCSKCDKACTSQTKSACPK
jgi:hypothetical protein